MTVEKGSKAEFRDSGLTVCRGAATVATLVVVSPDDDVCIERWGAMSSGNATSLMIFRLQFSTLSSDNPTQARSGAKTRTSPDVGE